jgi:predicted TIM-barrel enzyme
VTRDVSDHEALAELAGQHGIVLLLQFGSTVGGLVHARSAVDLAVLLERIDAHLVRSS